MEASQPRSERERSRESLPVGRDPRLGLGSPEQTPRSSSTYRPPALFQSVKTCLEHRTRRQEFIIYRDSFPIVSHFVALWGDDRSHHSQRCDSVWEENFPREERKSRLDASKVPGRLSPTDRSGRGSPGIGDEHGRSPLPLTLTREAHE